MFRSFLPRCILFILLFLFDLSVSEAQIVADFELDKLDSLLIHEQFIAINKFLVLKDAQLSQFDLTLKEAEEYNIFKNQYSDLINQMIKLYELPQTVIDAQIEQYKSFSGKFDPNMVGEKSASAYNQFLIFADQDEKYSALKYYLLAHHLKVRSIGAKSREISKKMKLCEEYFLNNKFTEAHLLVQSLEYDLLNVPNDPVISVEFRVLKEKILKKVNDIELNQRLLHQQAVFDKEYLIFIGEHLYFGSTDVTQNQSWRYSYNSNYATSYGEYNVDKISSNFGSGFSLGAQKYWKRKYKTEVDFGIGQSKVFVKDALTGMENKFDIAFFWTKLSVDYLFKETLGLRPLIGTGYQNLVVTREKRVEASIGKVIQYNFTLAEKTYVLHQLLLKIGTEYVASSDSKIILETAMTMFYHFNKASVIGQFGIFCGVRMGYAL